MPIKASYCLMSPEANTSTDTPVVADTSVLQGYGNFKQLHCFVYVSDVHIKGTSLPLRRFGEGAGNLCSMQTMFTQPCLYWRHDIMGGKV